MGRGKRRRKPACRRVWTGWPAERVLDLRLCDLHLTIERTPLARRIRRVLSELEARDLRFRPYFWLSEEWFTPHGATGCAIPFYLAHPRLTRLEREMTGQVEGGTEEWCMKLLRHEVGHALDNAYQLRRRPARRRLFGASSKRYPVEYRPNPHSRRHVQHLSNFYAQAHPDEDFAETFAVWLRARSDWRRRYREWPVYRKLLCVDGLMREFAGTWPAARTRVRPENLPGLRKTLREHYRDRIGEVELEYPDFYDRDLRRIFRTYRRRPKRETAAAFIRRVRPEIIRTVSPWVGDYRYQLEHVLWELTGRCRELGLYVAGPEKRAKLGLAFLLTKQTMDSLYRRRRWVEM